MKNLKTIDEQFDLHGKNEINLEPEPWEIKAFVIASVVLTIATLLFLL